MALMDYGQDGPFCSRCLQAVRADGPPGIVHDLEATSQGRSPLFKLLLAAATATLVLSIAAVAIMRVV